MVMVLSAVGACLLFILKVVGILLLIILVLAALLLSFPKIMVRAMAQLRRGSSAIRYCSRRSSTFPLLSPQTLARNRPRGEQKARPMPLSTQAPIRAGEAPG